jgi:hypothetical protein
MMKKISWLISGIVVAVLLSAVSCASAPAASGSEEASKVASGVIIPKAASALAIDGTDTGWPTAGVFPINDTNDGITGQIHLCYDDTALYVYLDVNGAKPINFNHGKDIWNGNALEILLGLDPSESKYAGSIGDKDYQIGLSPGNAKAHIDPSSHDWTHGTGDPAQSIKVVPTAQGYQMSAKVLWSHFGYTPASGKTIALDFALDIASDPGLSRDGQWIMTGNSDFYHTPSEWTTMVQLE